MAREIKEILSDFLGNKGVSAVALVGRDGFVIESVASGEIDMDAMGAMVATAIGASESMGSEFNLGELSQYLIEFDRGKIVVASAGDDILSIFADDTAVIGGIRYAVKKGIEELVSAM